MKQLVFLMEIVTFRMSSGGDGSSEESMRQNLDVCEQVIEDIESGRFATKDLQDRLVDCIARLEQLTRQVNELALFSSNEFVEELPSSSLSFLLLPCYLGVAHHNTITEPMMRIEQLHMAKTYYCDFLSRLAEYGVINFRLPWKTDDGEELKEKADDGACSSKTVVRKTGEELRQEKMARFKQQKTLENALQAARKQRELDPDDDFNIRELYMIQLRYWSIKLLGELNSIEDELPILEHMMKVRSGQVAQPDLEKKRKPGQKPFIITRSAEQKKVFGLGYPSMPVLTVDEWYQQMEASGRWGSGRPGEQPQTIESHPSDSENEDETDPEYLRQKAMRWDEYKDTHRRGWGNTHNKG